MKTITILWRLVMAVFIAGVSIPGVLFLLNLDSAAPLPIWIGSISTVICCPVLMVIAMWHDWTAEQAGDAARGRASIISLAVLAVLGVALYGFYGWLGTMPSWAGAISVLLTWSERNRGDAIVELGFSRSRTMRMTSVAFLRMRLALLLLCAAFLLLVFWSPLQVEWY
jgi:hypothetical protein